jgi:hypothetical protein
MMDPTSEKTAAAVGLDHDHVDGPLRETDVAVQLAHDVDDAKYSPWSLRMARLYLVLSLSYLCGTLNGYDGSLMGGLNGLTV